MDPSLLLAAAYGFRRFTPNSLFEIENRIAENKAKQAQAKQDNSSQQVKEEQCSPQLDLKACNKLPTIYGKPSPELVGVPLEDLDPYYSDHKTFMVLNSKNIIFRFSATPALCILGPFNPIRRAAIKILVHSLFILFIICVVVLNCVLMAQFPSSEQSKVTEYIFTGIYTAEISIKILARGFVWNEFTFLRDPCDCLDFIVIIMTYISLIGPLQNVSALRTFRVLRTFKAISVLPDSHTQHYFSRSESHCLQLFTGHLQRKCVLNNITYNESLCKEAKVYDPNSPGDVCARMKNSNDILLCNPNSELKCPENYSCEAHKPNPDFGYTSFDNFGWAFLSMFRLMTQDSWERLYRQVIRTTGKTSMIFFVVVIFLCSFYLFNLILAVVTMAYEEQNQATQAEIQAKEKLFQEAEELLKKEQMKSARKTDTATTNSFKGRTTEPEGFGDDERIFHSQPAHCQKKLKKILTSYDVSLDAVNDAYQRQRLMSAASIITDNMTLKRSIWKCPPSWNRFAQKYLIWQCCPLWIRIKESVKLIGMDPLTDLFFTLCIVVNTVVLALEHPTMNQKYKDLINIINHVFTGIFTAEMILKMIALDPYYYFQEHWNIFDSLIVVLGLMSIPKEINLSFLKLLRIFKLAKSWPALNKLMKIILKSFGALSNLTLVLIITVFIFAVVGKQVLGSYYENSTRISTDGKLRWHMKDLSHSLLIVFRILCGEWIETMWECMEVAGKARCLPVFLTVLVIGNLVVLNLFIALLLSSFSSNTQTTPEGTEMKLQLAFDRIYSGLQFMKRIISDQIGKILRQELTLQACQKAKMKATAPAMKMYEDFVMDTKTSVCVPIAEEDLYSMEYDDSCSMYSTEMEYGKWERHLRHREQSKSSGTLSQLSRTSASESMISMDTLQKENQQKNLDAMSCSEASTVDMYTFVGNYQLAEKPSTPEDCFTEGCVRYFPFCSVDITKYPGDTWWRFRKTCFRIVEHNWFENFIIFMIVLSSGSLAFEDIYLENRKNIQNLLNFADIMFTYIFFLEMILKWVAYGFQKYFTSAWCWLDFVIVWISFISFGPKSTSILEYLCAQQSSLKSIRTLRALRPLRALSRFEGIKVAVHALLGAIPSILNVMLVCVVFWLLFNLIGVNEFGGKFWKCTNISPNMNITNKNDCVNFNVTGSLKWENTYVNFDHVGMGYLALLQVATFKGWMDIMYAAVDSHGGLFWQQAENLEERKFPFHLKPP
ncbi:hypothetical protein Y1Q_0014536 [Alligator mississippiensis]|uniref:Sodium channel protein type 5 subunit alpha n=1 Tax=Alligator mississippiensis TaxID=8496 RepID=A0A151PD07_ALLMI|nr:hypothetical protein Y1Q_0014536 [Alligator mississippiensis]